jgi:hypothetical protein
LGGMLFASFLPVLFSNRLKCGYLVSTLFLHVQPGILAFAATGWIGGQIDRSNPWATWRWIRLGWGLDPVLLAAAPGLAVFSPTCALALVFAARTFRGLVMGGSWLLWWQVGVCHFARPGADTTRYQGMALFMNGIARLTGPIIGALLLHSASIEVVLLAGGGVVLLSAWLSSRELAREESTRSCPRLSVSSGNSRESGDDHPRLSFQSVNTASGRRSRLDTLACGMKNLLQDVVRGDFGSQRHIAIQMKRIGPWKSARETSSRAKLRNIRSGFG